MSPNRRLYMSKISLLCCGLACGTCGHCLSAVCSIENVSDLGSDSSLQITNTLLIIQYEERSINTNECDGISESNTHRPVFELGFKSSIATQTVRGDDTLLKGRQFASGGER